MVCVSSAALIQDCQSNRVGRRSPVTHRQSPGDPWPARRHPPFLRIAFAPKFQLDFGPSGLAQHLSNQALRFPLVGFLQFQTSPEPLPGKSARADPPGSSRGNQFLHIRPESFPARPELCQKIGINTSIVIPDPFVFSLRTPHQADLSLAPRAPAL
jgi:hypothetical protein